MQRVAPFLWLVGEPEAGEVQHADPAVTAEGTHDVVPVNAAGREAMHQEHQRGLRIAELGVEDPQLGHPGRGLARGPVKNLPASSHSRARPSIAIRTICAGSNAPRTDRHTLRPGAGPPAPGRRAAGGARPRPRRRRRRRGAGPGRGDGGRASSGLHRRAGRAALSGRRPALPAPATRLDGPGSRSLERLRASELADLPVIVGGRSLGRARRLPHRRGDRRGSRPLPRLPARFRRARRTSRRRAACPSWRRSRCRSWWSRARATASACRRRVRPARWSRSPGTTG